MDESLFRELYDLLFPLKFSFQKKKKEEKKKPHFPVREELKKTYLSEGVC